LSIQLVRKALTHNHWYLGLLRPLYDTRYAAAVGDGVVFDGMTGFDGKMELVRVKRGAGENNIGMVAWLFNLKTPECPGGRQAVAIANDITYASGSFGPSEDGLFRAATEYALAERLPVIYLAANSGARVGLANEVRDCLQVRPTHCNGGVPVLIFNGNLFPHFSISVIFVFGISDYVRLISLTVSVKYSVLVSTRLS
jgi:hypothetical protein